MARDILLDPLIEAGRYRVRLAAGDGDLARALALRARLFRGDPTAADDDAFDPLCRHLLVEDRTTGALACTFRVLALADGRDLDTSYSAQFYDLTPLAGQSGPLAEVGRFCIAPEARDADVLRLAWAALTRIVDTEAIAFLFGCSSLPGLDVGVFADAFALLADRHLAPEAWRPRQKARDIHRFARAKDPGCDVKKARAALPPLLRSYLSMGGRVSDHAVCDRDLGTLHVFTGLEVARVPPARARALRYLAGA